MTARASRSIARVDANRAQDETVGDGHASSPWPLALVRRAGSLLVALPRTAGVVLAAGWMAFSWWLSSGPRGPQDGGVWWAFAANLAHAPLFGILALCWIVALPRRELGSELGANGRRWARLGPIEMAVVLALALAWGLTDEWHQAGVDGRVASWTDLVTDAVGASAVLVVAAYAGRDDASARGLLARLGLGLVACAAAAAVATSV